MSFPVSRPPLALPGLAVLLAAALAGCSSTPVAEPAPAPVRTVTPGAPAPAAAAAPRAGATAAAPSATANALPAYLDPKADLARGRSLFFDFDAALLRPDAAQLLERHGRYLAAHPGVPIKVEGNTDERGSAEYNLALGQRRAEAVRKVLELNGVKPAQITTVSWGRERPQAAGHDEAAWAQNRRADLVYPPR